LKYADAIIEYQSSTSFRLRPCSHNFTEDSDITKMPIFSKAILASAVASLCLSTAAAATSPVGFCAGGKTGTYSIPGVHSQLFPV
jgi:hypothetical protein